MVGVEKQAAWGRIGAPTTGGSRTALFYWARRAASIGEAVFKSGMESTSSNSARIHNPPQKRLPNLGSLHFPTAPPTCWPW